MIANKTKNNVVKNKKSQKENTNKQFVQVPKSKSVSALNDQNAKFLFLTR